MLKLIFCIIIALSGSFNLNANAKIIEPVRLSEFDNSVMNMYENNNKLRMEQNVDKLKISTDLMIIAERVALIMAESARVIEPNLDIFIDKNIFVKVDKLIGMLTTTEESVGEQYCFDNYANIKNGDSLQLDEVCSIQKEDFLKFTEFGYGRAYDINNILYTVYLYTYDKEETTEVTTDSNVPEIESIPLGTFDSSVIGMLNVQNKFRAEQGFQKLKISSDLMDLAEKEAQLIADLGLIIKPSMDLLNTNVFARVDKLFGMIASSGQYVGEQTCYDNYSDNLFNDTFSLTQNCLNDVHEYSKFEEFGFGRAYDENKTLYVVYLYSFENTTDLDINSTTTQIVPVVLSSFDLAVKEVFNKLNLFKTSNGYSPLVLNSELIEFAEKEIKVMADLGEITKPNLTQINKNVFARVDRLTGQINQTLDYIGEQNCFDNYSKDEYNKTYALSDTCLFDPSDIFRFTQIGHGRAFGANNTLYAIYIYAFDRIQPIENSTIVLQNSTVLNLNTTIFKLNSTISNSNSTISKLNSTVVFN